MILRFFSGFYNLYLSPNKEFARELKNILGFTPQNLSLYKLAFTHSSASSTIGENNERLEILGDAVLNMAITDFLYHKYPFRGEGFISELRSKIVNRNQLNILGSKIGLGEFLTSQLNNKTLLYKSSTLGNAIEALIGAVYLDRNYQAADRVVKKIVKLHLDIEEIEQTIVNFKSKVINYCQKNNKTIEFKLIDEKTISSGKIFSMGVFIDDVEYGRADDFNKKRAAQKASKIACDKLGLLE